MGSEKATEQSSTTLTVVAALIENEGRLLVCQRRGSDPFGLKWEFPGGKVRRKEEPGAALARELQEELGADSAIGREIFRTRHRYAELGREIELIFFSAKLDPATIQNLAFEQMLWAEPAALAALDFLPADRELVTKLATGELRLPF
jgi:mutator protein MutT